MPRGADVTAIPDGKFGRKVVFIDTEVFDGYLHDYRNRVFGVLARLVEHGYVRVVITEVTRREVEAHRRDKFDEALRQLRSAASNSKILRYCTSHNGLYWFDDGAATDGARTELDAAFDDFMKGCDVAVAGVAGIEVASVLDDYFGKKAPFGEGKKKSEFPDAIAAAALRNWTVAQGIPRLHVVSRDQDWREVCAAYPAFQHVETLPGFLEMAPDPDLVDAAKSRLDERVLKEVAEEVRQQFEKRAKPRFRDVDGHIGDIQVDQVEFHEVVVLDASEDGTAQLEVEAELLFGAHATWMEPEAAGSEVAQDAEEHRGGFLAASHRLSVEIDIGPDPTEPDYVKVKRVSIGASVDVVLDSDDIERAS